MLEQVSFDHGLRVRGTPLWVDASRKRPLCLLTGAGLGLPPAHRRAVASPELCEALLSAGYRGSILPAPYDRWVGIGGREVQLVAAGPLGAAVAVVSSGRERIVVAGLLRQAQVHWPRGELLVATVPTLEQPGASFAQVARGVEMFARQAVLEQAPATVVVDSVEAALALAARLAERGVQLAPRGLLAKVMAQEPASEGVALGLWGGRVGRGRVAVVDTGLAAWAGLPPLRVPPAATFRLRWYADWAALRHAASMTGARAVVLVGAPSEKVARRELADVELRVVVPASQLGLKIEAPGSM